ncbi:helix-turn-helix transcriptional regulator [Empedobacter stercoris]|uniref:helix-turn-helix domain-containing protein n=1 Tax=Empedobacter stercoris TaxID=1628248 RepID=UPI001CE0F612|nr:helix-turn-helix transcriptional regulator [Empedobacter stercoris]MCA4782862.1 helix-turn-helix transcriptional regulator [Empedobacter stercoris]
MSKKILKQYYYQEEDFDYNINIKHAVKKIAFKIQFTLKSKKLSQSDLADLLNVSPQNISKLLKGEDYKVSTLVKIEEVLDIRLIDRDIKSNIIFEKYFTAKEEEIYKIYTKINNNIKISGSFEKEVNYNKVFKIHEIIK